jgi:ubiquinone/menaquinone biosynthesis C-methylase UbiE
MNLVRVIKDTILECVQIPANLVAALANEHPALPAKFFPASNKELFYVVPKNPPKASGAAQDLPVPPRNLWGVSFKDDEEYLKSGREHVNNMRKVLADDGFKFQKDQCILEIGCATCRLLRWLKPEAEQSEVWGVDIDASYINWCQQNLSPPFHFATTTTLPHLPFPDNHFDLVFAGSVFTHISDLADMWFLELKRVLKPNGRLYFTVSDSHTLNLFLTKYSESPLTVMIKECDRRMHVLDKGFGAFSIRRSPTGAQVIYDTEYLKQKVESMFRIHASMNEAYGAQTGMLVGKDR